MAARGAQRNARSCAGISQTDWKGVGESGLADAGFAGDEYDLPVAAPGGLKVASQLLQGVFPAGELARSLRGGLPVGGSAIADGSDELVTARRKGFDEAGFFGRILQGSAYFQNIFSQNLRLDVDAVPELVQDFVLANQAPGVLNKVAQNRKSLWRQYDTGLIPRHKH